MKPLPWFAAIGLILALIFTGPVHASDVEKDKVVMGGTYTLQEGEELDGNLIQIGGSATIENGAAIYGDILLVGGRLEISGNVQGDLNLIAGQAEAKPGAVIHGNVTVYSASFSKDEQARINGEVLYENNLPEELVLSGQNSLNRQAEPVGQRNPLVDFTSNLGTSLASSLIITILAMLMALFFSHALQLTADATYQHPFLAGGIGLLTMIAAPILVVLLCITIVLIPVAAAVILALAVACYFGWIAIGMELGNRIGALFKSRWHPVASIGTGTFLLTILLESIARTWWVGWIVIAVVIFISLGSVILTRFGTQIYEDTGSTVSRPAGPSPTTHLP